MRQTYSWAANSAAFYMRSPLSSNFPSITKAEPFNIPDSLDSTLPPSSELIAIAAVTESDVDEAMLQWSEEFEIATYRNMLSAEPVANPDETIAA